MIEDTKFKEIIELKRNIINSEKEKLKKESKNNSYLSIGDLVFNSFMIFFLLLFFIFTVFSAVAGEDINALSKELQDFIFLIPFVLSGLATIFYIIKSLKSLISKYNRKEIEQRKKEIEYINVSLKNKTNKYDELLKSFDFHLYLSDKGLDFFNKLDNVGNIVLQDFENLKNTNQALQNYMQFNKKVKNNLHIKND